MDKIENVLANVFDMEKPVVFFPIRHHSPACSYHVRRAIRLYQPDCVLIEGPCDTDSLIPCLIGSEPPVSIYYSYNDGDDPEHKHACYYPILNYSPEFVAAKTAAELGAAVHFIDLPYGNLSKRRRDLKNADTYYNEYFLRHSKYIELLCERENCRGYNELWEKLFELPARELSTEEFIRRLTAMCYYSRVDYPEELLIQEQDGEREVFMAHKIIGHRTQYQKILVVTGGFHTSGLLELIGQKPAAPVKPLYGEAYLIPYSFEESDRLTGYESGMPYPGFYQTLYDKLDSGNDNFAGATVLEYIAKLAKLLRKQRENISLSEEAAAFAMCRGLAGLRQKPSPGVSEFVDGVRSAFIKGELNLSTSFVLRQMTELLRGEKIGRVGENAPVPPIVVDFMNTAKSYRMEVTSSLPKTITLDIVSRKNHREQSVFLHRLQFLQCPYAQNTYGPDYERREGTKLIREKWTLSFSGRVTASLIEKSHLGGTIAQSCENMLSALAKDTCHCSADAADLLIKAGVMGLFTQAGRLLETMTEIIMNDHSFVSLTDCIRSLTFLQGIEHILRIKNAKSIKAAKLLAFEHIIPMLHALSATDEKEDFKLAQAVKMLYQIALDEPEINTGYFHSALNDLLEYKNISPALDGAVSGLILENPVRRADRYLKSSKDILKQTGRFLRGLFLTAKGVVFYNEDFISGINETVKNLPHDDFLEILPDLRLAFTYFTPLEIDSIAKKISLILGSSDLLADRLKVPPPLSENDLLLIGSIDNEVTTFMKEQYN